MHDLRRENLFVQNLRQIKIAATIVTCCVISVIGAIMLFSYLFAAPYHVPYRPSCLGSGVYKTFDAHNWENSSGDLYIVCNDGYSYWVS